MDVNDWLVVSNPMKNSQPTNHSGILGIIKTCRKPPARLSGTATEPWPTITWLLLLNLQNQPAKNTHDSAEFIVNRPQSFSWLIQWNA